MKLFHISFSWQQTVTLVPHTAECAPVRSLTDLTGEVGSVSESDSKEIAPAHTSVSSGLDPNVQVHSQQLPCVAAGCLARGAGQASGLEVKSTQVSSIYLSSPV